MKLLTEYEKQINNVIDDIIALLVNDVITLNYDNLDVIEELRTDEGFIDNLTYELDLIISYYDQTNIEHYPLSSLIDYLFDYLTAYTKYDYYEFRYDTGLVLNEKGQRISEILSDEISVILDKHIK